MPQRPSVPFSEKRRLLRARRSRAAACVFDDGASVLAVRVRDISPRGARIVGDGLDALPPLFELRIPTADDYSARTARLVWVRRTAAGVQFVD